MGLASVAASIDTVLFPLVKPFNFQGFLARIKARPHLVKVAGRLIVLQRRQSVGLCSRHRTTGDEDKKQHLSIAGESQSKAASGGERFATREYHLLLAGECFARTLDQQMRSAGVQAAE